LQDLAAIAWYISREGVNYGPFTADDFARFENEGQLTSTDYVWCTGFDQWRLYEEYRSSAARTIGKSPRTSPESGPHLLARKLIRIPYNLLVTVIDVIARPTEFAGRRIDAGSRDLYRASYFYLHLFTLAFVINASMTRFDFYRGNSQHRELALLAIQIAMAIPLMYVFNRATRQRVTFSGITQAVLYLDGIFIVLQNLLIGGLAYISFTQSIDRGELDVIATEIERCLSNNSYVYWFTRGELEYFYYVPRATTTWLPAAREYAQYVLVLPFCVAFGKLMKARYGASLWLNVIFAVVTYPIVFNATYYALGRIQRTLTSNVACDEIAAKQAFAKYNQAVVVRQIGERVNTQLSNALPTRTPLISINANGFVMDLRFPGHATLSQQQVSMISVEVRSLYCDNNTAFKFARAIQVPLLVIIRDPWGQPAHQEQITPSTCS